MRPPQLACPCHRTLAIATAVLGVLALGHGGATAKVPGDVATRPGIDFSRQIRPILSENCFTCHGPDDKQRKAKLRLDTQQGALAGGQVIVPGRPGQSELLERISSADPGKRMPPPKTGKRLTAGQIDLLREWIGQGAKWSNHWAFDKPVRPAPPAVENAAWARNPIDRFILARLEREGLKPAPEADRTTLIRRLTLDLTGLPPAPAEVDAFLADDGRRAYERLVDRLLNSPRYGERMALEWLDASRFADTHGYHIDAGRDMTRWREWVIEAFNRNLPFDQFTVEQLAGDLLPGAKLAQKVASGFNRNHMINFEGGAIPEEYQTAYIVDRVNTTGTVWLGLTVGCTQCHDHKYDPMTQKEFYQLYAFFHNLPENGLDGSRGNAAPLLKVPTPGQQERLDQLAASIRRLEQRRGGPLPEIDAREAEWEKAAAAEQKIGWTVLDPKEFHSHGGATLTKLEDRSVLAGGLNPVHDAYEVVLRTDQTGITAIRLEALTHKSLPNGGAGRYENANFVLTEFEAEVVPLAGKEKAARVRFVAAEADYSQPNYEIANAIDGDPASGWAVDGPTRREDRTALFVPAQPFGFPGGTELRVRLRFESQFPSHAIGRFRLAVTSAKAPLRGNKLPANLLHALAVAPERRTEQQRAELRNYYRTVVSTPFKALNDQLARLRKERADLDNRIPTAMVMQEMDRPRETHLLIRGQYDKKGEKVSAATPAFLPPLPKGAPPNRLGLAQWLVDPSNPLTARVTVNRYWQMYFGTGLVKTAEDFGSQGERPTHPELLDWLATEFVRTGWDVKAMQKLIVSSAAYRQSAAVTPVLFAKDPENRVLARGPRLRLQAEFIRDQALAVSGLLNGEIGGHSVSPYQPPGLWEELASRLDGANWTAQTYVQSHGKDLYRRSMYTFWKRTSPPPTMITFDAPDRETCAVRRSRTNTPLQALVLMNDPTYVEASRKLAERLMTEAGRSPEERITFAFRLATGRRPQPGEIAVLRQVFEQQLAVFRRDHQAASKLLAVGESTRNEKLDAAELAAWAMVSSAILNLDETVTKG
jgi:hypothetical protein